MQLSGRDPLHAPQSEFGVSLGVDDAAVSSKLRAARRFATSAGGTAANSGHSVSTTSTLGVGSRLEGRTRKRDVRRRLLDPGS